ncbi:hypothetical protein PHMEG_0007439 [Phytophthora megakarya]|uniref:UDENN domain-containing protein n=1 Tax=Phytophthora megakarya TaxID=4795 RepID=A0A225WN86_9STRA|nr:hypothetical protein PHMEG_0007439 [Phytophthora megakarya]
MSENEEDLNSINKQKSIFSGMTRVKQINHLREKWSPKLKTPLETPPSSPWSRRTSPAKTPLGQTPGPYHDSGRPSTRRTQSMSASPRGQPMVTIVDMERYLAINTWLESNSINVAQIKTCGDDPRTKSKSYGLFDDMYSSLEVLESNLKNEISHLNTNEENKRKDTSTASPPPLFDYLVVIGADMLDVKIRNFWNERENVFESTSVFAHPPESQFTAESLEHFCFPTGVKSFNTLGTSCDRRNELPDENPNFKQGEFFVLMISGGGVHGQSVQYAMCMKGVIVIRGPDGRNVLLPMCYCIIVQIPLIPFFRALLQGFLDNLRSELDSSNGCIPSSSIVTDEHAGYIDDVLQTLKNISLPDKGQSISVQVFPSPSPELTLARPHMDEKAVLVLQWALPSLLSHLSIDRLLQIMSLLLVEVKLVVVSDEIALLSSATLGFASLLNPLTWAGPLISVLPPSMHEYMEAPVPLICGVDELPRDFECSKGTCILHLAENRVQLHFEDERSIGKLQMPELKNLSCDLTRFTKQMLGRVTGSFRDNVTPLSTHLVIHRVRRHIEHVISVCALRREQHRNQEASYPLDASELNFVEVFMKTQMYQKYQDDQPISASTEQSNQQLPSVEPVKHALPIKTCPINTQHNGLKAAASVLFQIALAGVSTQPQGTTPSNIQDDDILISKIAVDEEIEIPSHDGIALPTPDKPDPGSVKLSSAASSPGRFLVVWHNFVQVTTNHVSLVSS